MYLLAVDVVVDTYLDEVVRSLGEQGLTNDAEEVEIHKDGHWDPILEDQKVGVSFVYPGPSLPGLFVGCLLPEKDGVVDRRESLFGGNTMLLFPTGTRG